MCGILGQISFSNEIDADLNKFNYSLNLMEHRGHYKLKEITSIQSNTLIYQIMSQYLEPPEVPDPGTQGLF